MLSFTGNVTSKITPELTAMFQSVLTYSKIEGMAGVTNQNIWYYTTNADRTIPAYVYHRKDEENAALQAQVVEEDPVSEQKAE